MTMKKNAAIKYVGSAMAVGGTVMMVSALASSSSSLKKKAKKTANKAIDAAYAVLTNVQNVMK
ncbi:MAG: hypothetical protein IK104_09730 [Clostridia bacterium]|nr:hypothetical protein [Clostridia bacterium]